MSQKILNVDPKKCIACAACTSLCPNSFTLDMNDPNAVAIAINPPKNDEETIKLSIEACPTNAIAWKPSK